VADPTTPARVSPALRAEYARVIRELGGDVGMMQDRESSAADEEAEKPARNIAQVPTETGTAPYGSHEAADALAPIWGMHPQRVWRIMNSELGVLDPATASVIDQIQQEQEAADVAKWGGYTQPTRRKYEGQ